MPGYIRSDLKAWIVKELEKRVKRAQAVLSKPDKYTIKDPSKLRNYVVMANRFLEWIRSIPTQEGIEYAEQVEGLKKEPSDLEKKLKDLETKVSQLELVVKKLVAYHEGTL